MQGAVFYRVSSSLGKKFEQEEMGRSYVVRLKEPKIIYMYILFSDTKRVVQVAIMI